MNLPTGIIVFLFTDIEGSARIWEDQPETMGLALARHDALLRAAIEANGGTIFKTVGDAFCAAFPTAPSALKAAISAQRSLQEIKAGNGSDVMLKVRMALHAGTAEMREGDYFGRPLNRVARLLATGHGGQILLSASVQELIRDAIPTPTKLKDMGEHRLRDLHLPERVFQLLHPDLLSEFPPLKSLEYLPTNLPQQLTSFIGREKEMAEVKDLLKKTRLLTLTGSGGTGKTRLSLQVAADLIEEYKDGVWLAELAPLADPALVVQTVTAVLGVREEAGQPLQKTLITYLKTKNLLLVLDNCEHLVQATATFATNLLSLCADVTLLLSSREVLNTSGETVYRIPSMSLPKSIREPSTEATIRSEAECRFVERAMALQPTFRVTSANAADIIQICRRLDGIPLAIELAAARTKVLSVGQIAARLDNCFAILTRGSRTALPHQQTLRALIDWSYDLLTEPEQVLFRRLSMFVGGWTIEAMEAICTGDGIDIGELLDLLTQIADKSLLLVEQGTGGENRFRLLEVVRQYGREKLQEVGEEEKIRTLHCNFFRNLAEEVERAGYGIEEGIWLDRLETEHDNVRAVLDWCQKDEICTESEMRLVAAMSRFWEVRGYFSEGRQWLARALDRSRDITTYWRAKALNGAGVLAEVQGGHISARAYHQQSLNIRRELGDHEGIIQSLNNLGMVDQGQGNVEVAGSYHEEALRLSRAQGNRFGEGLSLNHLGRVAHQRADYPRAGDLHERSRRVFQELGDRVGIAESFFGLGYVAFNEGDYALAGRLFSEGLELRREVSNKLSIAHLTSCLGHVARCQDDFEAAHTFYTDSLTRFSELGARFGIAHSRHNLGHLARSQKDFELARFHYSQSLILFQEIEDKEGIAFSFEGFAGLASELGHLERAARLFGAADSLRQAIHVPLPPADRDKYGHYRVAVQTLLERGKYDLAWEKGRVLTVPQAILYALEVLIPLSKTDNTQ